MVRHLLLFGAKLQHFLEQKKRSPLGFWNLESLRQRLSLVSNPDGETAERICMVVKHLILTERVNQLPSTPTLAAFEEKVLACLPKEQEQK